MISNPSFCVVEQRSTWQNAILTGRTIFVTRRCQSINIEIYMVGDPSFCPAEYCSTRQKAILLGRTAQNALLLGRTIFATERYQSIYIEYDWCSFVLPGRTAFCPTEKRSALQKSILPCRKGFCPAERAR